jgi:hypothetical protein
MVRRRRAAGNEQASRVPLVGLSRSVHARWSLDIASSVSLSLLRYARTPSAERWIVDLVPLVCRTAVLYVGVGVVPTAGGPAL